MIVPPVYDMRAVFVSDIPISANYHSLRSKFARFGDVKRLYLHPSTDIKMFAFVHFKSRGSVNRIMRSSEGIFIHGQALSVSLKKIDGVCAKKIMQSSNIMSDYYASPKISKEKRDGDFLSHLLSIRHVEDSLASKFQPRLETLAEDCSGDNTYDPSALNYDTNGELIIGESSAVSDRLIKSRNNADYSNHDCGTTRVVRVDGIPMSWDAGVLFSNLMQSGTVVAAVLVYDDVDDRNFRQGLIQLRTTELEAHSARKITLSSANVTLQVAPSSVQSIGPVRKGYSGKFSAFSATDSCDIYSSSDGELKESLTFPNLLKDLNLNGINFPNHGLASIPEERSNASECTTMIEKLCPTEEQEQGLPNNLTDTYGRQSLAIRDCVVVPSSPMTITYGTNAHHNVELFPLSASQDSITLRQRDSELWSPLSPYSPSSARIFPISEKKPRLNKTASKMSNLASPNVRQMTKSYLNSPHEDSTRKGCCLSSVLSTQTNLSNKHEMKNHTQRSDSVQECQQQRSGPNESTGCHEIPLTNNVIPISLAYTPKASQTLVVDNFWTNGVNDPAAFANSLAVFGEIIVADIVKISAEHARVYVTFASHISAELAHCRLSCRAGALQLRLA